MPTVTYVPREGDLDETEVGRVKFTAHVPKKLPPGREWLAHKLADNPWFKVEHDKPAAKPPKKKHKSAAHKAH